MKGETVDSDVEDFLAHYGVVGMKWGRRKGGLKARFKDATLDRNQRQKAINTRAKEGRSTREERVRLAPIRLLKGKKRFEAHLEKQNVKIDALSDRVKNGKMTVLDKIVAYGATNNIDLLISRQDDKG